MTVRKILTYPHHILREKALPMRFLAGGALVRELAVDLRHTLAMEEDGLALSANQIGSSSRMFVINQRMQIRSGLPGEIINPSFVPIETGIDDVKERKEEGCLSFPGILVNVLRWRKIKASFQDMLGNFRFADLTGEDARCFQHEVDHLDGKLFIDDLGSKNIGKIGMQVLQSKRKKDLVNLRKARR